MIETELAVVIGVVVFIYLIAFISTLQKKLQMLSRSSIELVMSYNNVVTSLHIAGKALQISIEKDDDAKLRDVASKAAKTLQSIQAVPFNENQTKRPTIPNPPPTSREF